MPCNSGIGYWGLGIDLAMSDFYLRALNDDDRQRVRRFLIERWGSARVVSRGKMYHADALPGFVAMHEDRIVGLATQRIDGDACELVTLDSATGEIGIGSALIEAVKNAARQAGCTRLWLITTNDNTPAIRFYQKRGFVMAALHRDALEASRKLKPEIPLTGVDGISIRDEIEFELEIGE